MTRLLRSLALGLAFAVLAAFASLALVHWLHLLAGSSLDNFTARLICLLAAAWFGLRGVVIGWRDV